MGFNKLVRTVDRSNGFVPSTKADLKRYAANGKKHQKERAEVKNARKGAKNMLRGERRSEYRDMFARHDEFDVLSQNVIDLFAETVKENESKLPRYKEYLPRKDADAEFVLAINTLLARMSWIQLSKLVCAAVGCPVVTKEYTEAYNFAAHALLRLVLGVRDEKGVYRVTDLDALKMWPVESRKRPSKEDSKMSRKEAALVASGKMKASADSDDEDEDEDAEAEEAEDEDEEEDEKPKKGRKAAPKKAVKKAKDEDDEDEDESDEDEDDEEEDESDEDEDEDDEEEETGAKAARAKQSKRARGKAVEEDESDEDDEDEDESDEDDEDEDEEDQPKKRGSKPAKETTVSKKAKADKTEKADKKRPEAMKLKGEVPKPKKAAKPAKAAKPEKAAKKGAKPEKAEKAVKRVKKAAVALDSNSVVSKAKDRPAGGPKTKLLALMPKKGIKLSALTKLAEEELGLNAKKVLRFTTMMAKNGFVKVQE